MPYRAPRIMKILNRAPHPSPLPSRQCRNEGNAIFVSLNEVKNLRESINYKTEILRLRPQNDITTQSPQEGGRGWGVVLKAKREQLTHPFRSSIRCVTSLFALYTEDPVRLPRIISAVVNTLAFKRCPPVTAPEEVPRIACR